MSDDDTPRDIMVQKKLSFAKSRRGAESRVGAFAGGVATDLRHSAEDPGAEDPGADDLGADDLGADASDGFQEEPADSALPIDSDTDMIDAMPEHFSGDDAPRPDPAEASAPQQATTGLHEVGCIDSYGFSHAAGAWIAIGWVPCLPSTVHECDVTMYFARASLTGRCYRAPFYRADLGAGREGVIVLAGCAGRDLGPLVSLTLTWDDDDDARLFSTEQVEHLTDTPITGAARTLLTNAPRDVASLAILRALSQPRFGGNSTLHEVGAPIHMAVDEVIRCGDAGVVLIGWFVAEEGAARRILLRAGQNSFEVELSRAIRIRREDVSSSIMSQHGLHEPAPGYILFVPGVTEFDDKAHLQIETRDLSVGYVALPKPRLRGVPAMRRMLEAFALRYEDMVRAYDRVIGPAIGGLNAERLRTRVPTADYVFGVQPAEPVVSVIVPLYGRIDFMEYQLALFSREKSNVHHEFIYVLDDPSIRVETLTLAESCFARFGLPFRVVALERNVGYAPANNAGLRSARGRLICFLNSDVFPGNDHWLDAMVARLDADRQLGAVGPTLLFEDGTVQHRGLTYEPLQEFARWLFPMHPGKGMRIPHRRGLEYHRAITGACMVMTRALAESLGGFDETFVIGDFEDSDLCLRIGARGLSCAVDLDVHLYHLERQSQGDMSNAWRFNLTLYNAWVHEGRWRSLLTGDQLAHAAD